MKHHSLPTLALASSLLLMASSADGVQSNRFRYQTAAKDCQGALPAFAGTLRARPLALGNEGSSTAFVTCGFMGDGNFNNETTTQLAMRVGHNGPGDATITCTLVLGFGGSVYPAVYLTKSVEVSQGTSNVIFWNAGEGGTDLENAQMSCALPPGALLYHSYSFGSEEIGT